MDLSPGSWTLPRTLRAGRTITWEPSFILRSILAESTGHVAPDAFVRAVGDAAENAGGRMRPPLRVLGQRLGFCGGLFENVGRDFFHGYAELEHGRFGAAAPACELPVRA